jgi:hypothetical protein
MQKAQLEVFLLVLKRKYTICLLRASADSERLLKQAKESHNGWGLNRIYVVTENPNRWLSEPRALMSELELLISRGLEYKQLPLNDAVAATCCVLRLT